MNPSPSAGIKNLLTTLVFTPNYNIEMATFLIVQFSGGDKFMRYLS